MSLLIRKINKAKWFQINVLNDSDVSADAITNCLKTSKNTLSVWNIQEESDLDNAILAIVASQDHLDTIDIVILEHTSLIKYNIKIVASPGDTPINTLIDTHRDLEELTFSKLGIVKDYIVERIRNDKLKRYTVATLKKLLKSAIENGLIKKEDLKETMREKI
ncbi:MAG: hypothetical protein QM535_22625 [Limnohabitans sp.]|nr:hypothetical protein [Limnohabitans sp.]